MNKTTRYCRQATARDLLFFHTPALWPQRPFLPLVRRSKDGGEQELGLLFDARGMSGTYGYSATVFLANLLEIPSNEAEFLALPKIVYDTPEELADDGWQVD
jgi:hypothetical protein